MKKQIKKLSLNKKTISNLQHFEMSKKIGGSAPIYGCGNHSYYGGCGDPGKTKNGNTCPGHNTCYTC